jgi:hypothetical protein
MEPILKRIIISKENNDLIFQKRIIISKKKSLLEQKSSFCHCGLIS